MISSAIGHSERQTKRLIHEGPAKVSFGLSVQPAIIHTLSRLHASRLKNVGILINRSNNIRRNKSVRLKFKMARHTESDSVGQARDSTYCIPDWFF